MTAGLWQRLLRAIGPQEMVSSPAVWGKLPEHGDFVHYRGSMAEREVWQGWVQNLAEQRPHRDSSGRNKSRRAAIAKQWTYLEPPSHGGGLESLPVAFVLPPGMLAFASNHYVQGVITASHDKVGRPCPLVIYQYASPVWMQRLWAEGAAMGGRDLLFWWARLAILAVYGHTPWSAWLALFDQVWQAHAPGWQHLWLGAPPRQVPAVQIQSLLGPTEANDPACHCVGVEHLPWVNWPERLWLGPQRRAAFWTQDEVGRYVQASHHLHELWSREP